MQKRLYIKEKKDYKHAPKSCLVCGTKFYKSYYKSLKFWNEKSKFCSQSCRSKSVANSLVARGICFSKDVFRDQSKHPRWKGGISTKAWYRLIYSRNYKIRKKGAIGQITPKEWVDLKSKYKNSCLSCKKSEPEIKLEADHIVPLVMGGTNFISNIQPLCRNCNAKKYITTIDYRKSLTI